MAETRKPRSPARQAETRGEARIPSEDLALAHGLPDPFLTSGNRSGFHIWRWGFFIILYKNKSAFRNFFLLSRSLLSLSRSLSFIFFLSFQLFIEVGYNL